MQKILYFTAGALATETELEEIDALNALAEKPYEVFVRRGDSVGSMAYGAGVEATDYIAGTPPAPYDNTDPEEGPVYPVFDPDNPPVNLPPEQAIVTDGQIVGTYTITVVDNEVTAIDPV